MWQQCRAINRCCESSSGNISIVLVGQDVIINASAERTRVDIRYRPPFSPYKFIDSFFFSFFKPNNLILKKYIDHFEDDLITSNEFARIY